MLEWLPWQDAAVVAGACTGATAACSPRRRWVPAGSSWARWAGRLAAWTRELALMFALYGLWQLAGDLSVSQGAGAVARGRAIWRVEREVGLPSEASVQSLVLGHPELIRILNGYYAQVHVPALGVCLVWLFVRHRDRYPAFRNVVVAVTGASLLIQLLPVAPPRLVPGLGVADLGRIYGPSVYPETVRPGLDQLSAMPSLHVGWALLVAGAVVWALRSRWRWLAVLYPAATWFTVLATGNHYWADGFAATALCAASVAVAAAVRRHRTGRYTPCEVTEVPGYASPVAGPAMVG